VRIHAYAHIRAIVVLSGSKLTEFYFSHLLYSIYYSVTALLREGKKVSFLPPSDMNPGSVPSRRGLYEDSPYHVVGVACLSCD
jgi:hypothetical protein